MFIGKNRTRNKNLRVLKKIKTQQRKRDLKEENFKPNITFFTGAGISKESGLSTFRDNDGLWENFDVQQVSSITGFREDPVLVNAFFNARRKEIQNAEPNDAHLSIAKLEEFFNVNVITQNVDNLHERAGTSNVLHLHGKITQARSSNSPKLIYKIGYRDIKADERCKKDNSKLRPNIVFFGEQVPLIPEARQIIASTDIFIVIGTSLNVEPAASLIDYVPKHALFFLIDPYIEKGNSDRIVHYSTTATNGLKELSRELTLDMDSLKKDILTKIKRYY